MKKFVRHLVYTVFFIGIVSCSSTVTTGEGTGLLWQISGNGLKNPSYLFGTHHLVLKQFLDSVPGFYPAFNSVSQLISEVGAELSPEMMNSFPDMMMPVDTTYRDLLGDEDLRILDSVLLKYFKVTSGQMSMKPSILSYSIMMMYYFEDRDIPKDILQNGLDGHLTNEALSKGYPVVALESADSQYQLLFKGSLTEQALELMCTLKYPALMEAQVELEPAYHRQDLDKLWKIYQDQLAEIEKIDIACQPTPEEKEEDALVKGRNLKWMEKIPGLITEQPSIIVVGALHLPGEYGLIHQLREKGYTVRVVKK
ncbi:MAG: TraB/GumN family protein [Bacteroidales bacterium]|jgi:uncharacterized protein YbaP (TraB family)|nr:TraB/GumN family protein [Bacteroidales bacterium]